MPSQERQTVQRANARIAVLLASTRRALTGERGFGVAQVEDLSEPIQEMAPLMARAGEVRATDPWVARDLDLYKSQLSELQTALEQVRVMLLAQRAQMDAGRAQLDAMSRWATALRQTQ